MEEGASWNVEMIIEMFWEEKARLIESIPLSFLKPHDVQMWNTE